LKVLVNYREYSTAENVSSSPSSSSPSVVVCGGKNLPLDQKALKDYLDEKLPSSLQEEAYYR